MTEQEFCDQMRNVLLRIGLRDGATWELSIQRLYLRHVKQLSYKAIATQLGVTPSAVRETVERTHRRLAWAIHRGYLTIEELPDIELLRRPILYRLASSPGRIRCPHCNGTGYVRPSA